MQDVLDVGQFVLATARSVSHPCADLAGRENNERHKQQEQPSQVPAQKNHYACNDKNVKNCCRNSERTLDMANCTRSMSFTMVDTRVPVVCFWKNAADRRRIDLYREFRRSVISPYPA